MPNPSCGRRRPAGGRLPLNASCFAGVGPGSPEPIYRQLVEQVRRSVAGGQIRAGDEIPSVRELAKALSVHPMTISKAYAMLQAQGVLQRRRGQTMVVADQHRCAKPAASRLELLRPTLERAAREARQLQLPRSEVLGLFRVLLEGQDTAHQVSASC